MSKGQMKPKTRQSGGDVGVFGNSRPVGLPPLHPGSDVTPTTLQGIMRKVQSHMKTNVAPTYQSVEERVSDLERRHNAMIFMVTQLAATFFGTQDTQSTKTFLNTLMYPPTPLEILKARRLEQQNNKQPRGRDPTSGGSHPSVANKRRARTPKQLTDRVSRVAA